MKFNKTKMPLINLIQERIANISVGSSTVRGQPKKTKEIVINYLKKSINLNEFSDIKDESQFKILLDNHTDSLKEQIPSKSWGITRKVLNIFLFQVSHDIFLNKKYGLDKIIPYLELPLDNPNAKKLKEEFAKSEGKKLDWKNIKSLKPNVNKEFQEYAQRYAKKEYNCERCYLDVYWWRSEEK